MLQVIKHRVKTRSTKRFKAKEGKIVRKRSVRLLRCRASSRMKFRSLGSIRLNPIRREPIGLMSKPRDVRGAGDFKLSIVVLSNVLV